MKVALECTFKHNFINLLGRYHISTDEENFDGKYMFASSFSSLLIELVHN